MSSSGYNGRKAAIIKAFVVLLFGFAGLCTRNRFGVVLGLILVVIGGRDLYRLLKDRPRSEKKAPARKDGLQITDLSEVKDAEYKREEDNGAGA